MGEDVGSEKGDEVWRREEDSGKVAVYVEVDRVGSGPKFWKKGKVGRRSCWQRR